MEKAPSERKPNRVFRGRIIHAVLAEVFDWRRKPSPANDIGYEPVGIGAMDAGQLTIAQDQPEHWHNWPENGQPK